jgi:hypothetical protein
MQVAVESMEVKEISHRKSRRRTYDIAVTYRYEVDGRSHQGTSRFGSSPFESEQQAEQTMKSLEGKQVDGWYVTKKPSMSALDVERAIGDTWKNIGIAGFVSLPALAGIAASVVGVMGLRKRLRSA